MDTNELSKAGIWVVPPSEMSSHGTSLQTQDNAGDRVVRTLRLNLYCSTRMLTLPRRWLSAAFRTLLQLGSALNT